MKKAITVTISLLIILGATIAIAIGAWIFISKLQIQSQGSTEASQNQFLANLGKCARLISFYYNSIDNETQIVVKNCGRSEIELANQTILQISIGDKNCFLTLNEPNCINCAKKIALYETVIFDLNSSAYCENEPLANILSRNIGVQGTAKLTFGAFSTSTIFTPQEIMTCGRILTWDTKKFDPSCIVIKMKNIGKHNDTIKEAFYFYNGTNYTNYTFYSDLQCSIVDKECGSEDHPCNYTRNLQPGEEAIYSFRKPEKYWRIDFYHNSTKCPSYIKTFSLDSNAAFPGSDGP
ncbi:MAG: hypothetical protein QW625_00405 [Candidatus Nanoarchaeia archaeon]